MAKIHKGVVQIMAAHFPNKMVDRQGQDAVINEHGQAELDEVRHEMDILAGQEKDATGDDEIKERRPKDQEQRQEPLLFFNIPANITANRGNDQIRQEVDANCPGPRLA